MRELKVIDVSDPRALTEPLRDALFHGGPAVLPRPGGAKLTATAPLEVDSSIALVVETSGTTGAPKRVALGAEAVLASARAANDALGGPGQWLQVLPAHYIAGIQVVTRSLCGDTEPVVLHPEPFSTVAMASRLSHLIEVAGDNPRYTSVVPAQLRRILDDARTMPQLEDMMRGFSAILVGGQSIPADVLEHSHAAGYRIIRTYGSTETSGGCVWDQRPIGDTRIALIEGRIALGGSMLATQYLENPERTARSFITRNGARWYLSDDAGHLDSEGLLVIEGRLDDVIVSGGVKIALGAVERIIQREFPGTDALVVGAPHHDWGHVPVIVTTQVIDLERARVAVARELGPEARPQRSVQVAEIPLLDSGKPHRLAATELAEGK